MNNREQDNMDDQQEISAKRKNSNNNYNGNQQPDFEEYHQISKKRHNLDEDDKDSLTLSLTFGRTKTKPTSPPPQAALISNPTPTLTPLHFPLFTPLPPPPPPLVDPVAPSFYLPASTISSNAGTSRPPRARRNPTQGPREGKSDSVPPPFLWATNHRATVHTLEYLLSKKINTITGQVQCKRCEKQYEMGFDLETKFVEVGRFIVENKSVMHDRAPSVWMTPLLPKCKFCDQENSVKPLISDKKKSINWLFLLLGQMLGCCTLEQLKYFCKHTKNHRTGAKDRVLYLTYLGLCKQLDPTGPFDR